MKAFALAGLIAAGTAVAAAAQQEQVYRPGQEGVKAPVVVFEKKPAYTAAAMRAKIAGAIELQAIIDVEGKPTAVQVVRSLDPGLDQKAVEALTQWRFKPGTRDGKPVPVMVTVEMTFTLRDGLVFQAGEPGIKSPVVIKEAKPTYTAAAMRAKVQGGVELECVVGVDGVPRDIKVVKSLDTVHGTDQQAVEALEQWRFEPALLDGKPVPMRVKIEMTFTLRDRN